MSEGKRVVLVKPGDILVFGNVGSIEPDGLKPAMTALREMLGIAHVVVFDGDIDMDHVPAP